jgi:glycosyltransferase involved in cell wall biosynthesis
LRLGILSPALRRCGGIERVPVTQAKLLGERGHDVVLVPGFYEKSCYPDLLGSSGVQLKYVNLPLPILRVTINSTLSTFVSYRYLKNRETFVSHGLSSAYRAYSKLGIPYVLYVHTVPWHPRRSEAERIDRYFKRAVMIPADLIHLCFKPVMGEWERLAIRGAGRVLVNSRNTGEQLADMTGGMDYEVCYPAVDLELATGRDLRLERLLRQRFGLGGNVILSVSRHNPKKCLHWLPQILYTVKRSVPDAKLAITGARTVHTSLIDEEIRRWGVRESVVLTGELSEKELYSLYHISKVLCLPSVREDFGLPLVEAMASGCLPVAWNDDAGPSEVIEDGVGGFLCEPYDLAEMASHTVAVLQDDSLRRRMSERAVEKGTRFDWTAHVNVLEKALAEVSRR